MGTPRDQSSGEVVVEGGKSVKANFLLSRSRRESEMAILKGIGWDILYIYFEEL